MITHTRTFFLGFITLLLCLTNQVLANCDTTTEIVCGQIISLENNDFTSDTYGFCAIQNSVNKLSKWLTFQGTGQTVYVDIGAANVSVGVTHGTCDLLECVPLDGFYNHSTGRYDVRFHSEIGVQYLIDINLLDVYVPFEISISCAELIESTCETAEPLICSSTLNNDFRFVQGIVQSSCRSRIRPGQWYSYQGNGQNLVITSDDQFLWNSIEVYSGDCSSLNCEDYTYAQGKLSFYTLDERTYYLFVESSYVNPLAINIDCVTPPINDRCSASEFMVCGGRVSGDWQDYGQSLLRCNSSREDFFLKIDGEEKFYKITSEDPAVNHHKISYRDNFCMHGVCNPITNDEYFFIEENQNITVLFSRRDDHDQFDYSIYCQDVIPASDCSQSISIECNNSIEDNLDFLDVQVLPGVGNRPLRVKWFEINNIADVINVRLERSTQSKGNIGIAIYETNCFNLEFLDNTVLNPYDISKELRLNAAQYPNAKIAIYTQEIEYDFTLSINCISPPANNHCSTPSIVNCSEIINYDTKDASYDNDCNIDLHSGFKNLFYEIFLTDPTKFYVLKFNKILNSNVQFRLWYECGENCDINNDIQVPGGQNYLIEIFDITSSTMNTGQFSFTCDEVLPAGNIHNASTLYCGETVGEHELYVIDSIYNLPCLLNDVSYITKWYKIQGDGGIWNFDFQTNCTNQVNLYLETSSELSCLFTGYRNFEYLLEQDSIYYIVVIDHPSGHGLQLDYTLEITCRPQEIYNRCEGAQNMACGESFTMNFNGLTEGEIQCNYIRATEGFITITGEDKYVELDLSQYSYRFSISCFKGGCDDITCIDPVYDSSYYLEKDTIYYFAIRQANPHYVDSVDIVVNCLEPFPVSLCSTATEIQCNDTIQATTKARPLTEAPSCIYQDSVIGVWYTFVGTGQIVELAYSSQISLVITQGSCDENCNSIYNSTHPTSFLAEQGEVYYLLFYSSNSQRKDFSIQLTCKDALPNSSEDNPLPISCEEEFYMDFTRTYEQPLHCGGIGRPLYFSIRGNDHYVSFYRLYYFSLYRRDNPCENVPIINNHYYLEKDVEYIIETIYVGYPLLRTTMFCRDVVTSSDIEDAALLTCNTTIVDSLIYAAPAPFRADCIEGENRSGRWYKVTNENDNLFELSLTSGQVNWYIFERVCDELLCLSENRSFRISQSSPKEYYIYVYTNYLLETTYNINVQCWSSVSNNNCSDAIPISCNMMTPPVQFDLTGPNHPTCRTNENNVYYIIKGENGIYTFSSRHIDIFEYGCDSDQCLDPLVITDTSSVYQLSGKHEYILTFYENNQDSNFQILCEEEAPIEYCADAYILNGTDTIEGSLEFQKSILTDSAWCISSEARIDWYKINGEGKIYTLSSDKNQNIKYKLLFGSCSFLSCSADDLREEYLYNEVSFYLDNNEDVYVALYVPANEKGDDYELRFSSREPNSNALCETAPQINCGHTFTLDLTDAFYHELPFCYNYSNYHVYYKTIGAGNFIFFGSNNHRFTDYDFSVIRSDCNDLYDFDLCLNSVLFSQRPNNTSNHFSRSFFLEEGVEYTVVIGNRDTYDPPIEVHYYCSESIITEPCEEILYIQEDTFLIYNNIFHNFSEVFDSCNYEISPHGVFYNISQPVSGLINVASNRRTSSNKNYLFDGNCSAIGECSEGIIMNDYQNYKFELGDQIYLTPGSFFDTRAVNVSFKDIPAGNDCSDPIAVLGDTTISWQFIDYSLDLIEEENLLEFYSWSNAFFSIKGMGQILEDVRSTNNRISYKIYEADCQVAINSTEQLPLVLEDEIDYIVEARIYFFSNSTSYSDISFKLSEELDTSTCFNATQIFCGDTVSGSANNTISPYSSNCWPSSNDQAVWFSIVGDDHVYQVDKTYNFNDLQIFSGDCDSLICLPIGPNLFTEGSDYYIRVGIDEHTADRNYQIQVECNTPVPNATIDHAITLTCNSDIFINFDSVHLTEPDVCINYLGLYRYYRIIGEGKFVTFSQPTNNVHLSLIHDGNCIVSDANEINEYLEQEEEYIILVRSRYNSSSNLIIECSDGDPVLCEDVEELECGTLVNGTIVNAYHEEPFADCHNRRLLAGKWFSIQGNDGYLNMDVYHGNAYVYLDSCVNNICPIFQFPNDADFFIDSEIKYYIYFEPRTRSNMNYTIRTNCFSKLQNGDCENNIEIACGYEENLVFQKEFGAITNCTPSFFLDAWYSIVGTNDYYKLNFSGGGVEVLVGSCEEYVCLESNENDEYYLKKDIAYTVRAYGFDGYFNVTCIPSLILGDQICKEEICEFAGLPCDDKLSITNNDRYDHFCDCIGTTDHLDDCSESVLTIDSIHANEFTYISDSLIYLKTSTPQSSHLTFQAGQSFIFEKDLEIPVSATLTVNIKLCINQNTDHK